MDGLKDIPLTWEPLDIGTALNTAGDVDAQKRLVAKWLDKDRPTAHAFWEHVEAHGGLSVGDWHFVADPKCAERILLDEPHFSVREYDRRMRTTSGRFFLGMDGAEHDRDARLGKIIPSWNTFRPGAHVDLAQLDRVRAEADHAAREVLVRLARNTALARLTNGRAECHLRVVELLGPVLDACASTFLGVPGPSGFSLVAWAKDVTAYHFRVQADDAVDRSPARHASAEFRAHVLALIGSLPRCAGDPTATEPEGVLGRAVATLRERLRPCEHAHVSDEDVARNLIGILTGSITATYKAFLEALSLQPTAADGRIAWSEPAAQRVEAATAGLCPYANTPGTNATPRASFPHYDAVIAGPLAGARRGSLDAIYRQYEGPNELRLGKHALKRNDLVVVWIGGTLRADPDNLFGIGKHKCPGMDMAKAILEGVLQVLTSLRGPDSPRRELIDGELALTFDNVRALEQLAV